MEPSEAISESYLGKSSAEQAIGRRPFEQLLSAERTRAAVRRLRFGCERVQKCGRKALAGLVAVLALSEQNKGVGIDKDGIATGPSRSRRSAPGL